LPVDIRKTHRVADLFPTGALIVLGALIASAAIWIALFQYIEHQEADAMAGASAANVNLAMAFSEHVLRILKDVDESAGILRREIRQKGIRNMDLAAYHQKVFASRPFVHQLTIIDERGWAVASSSFVTTNRLDDREHYVVHTHRDSRAAYIGKPVVWRSNGKWFIPMSWRLNAAGGAFAGVLTIAVDPGYFSEFYDKALLGDGIVVLMRNDGALIARRGRSKVDLGRDLSHAAAFQVAQESTAGVQVSAGTIDGVPRLIAYQVLSDYPLSVHVGTSVNEILAPVREHWPGYYLAAAVITFCLFSGSLALAWSSARQKRATRALIAGGWVARRLLKENRAALQEVREAEEKYRSVIEAMAEGVVMRDASGTITACNRSAERILGIDADQLLGRNSIDANECPLYEDGSPYSAEDRPSVATLRTGAPVTNVTMGVHRHDGTLIWISINTQPLFRPDATCPHAIVTTFQDVTERKESSERIAALSHRLIEVQEEERRKLARELHDEIGQVLTAVSFSLKSVASLDTDGTLREVVGEGLTTVERAIGQVRSMSLDLRPPLLDELGIVDALRWLAQQQESRTGVSIVLEAVSEDLILPVVMAEASYRVAQEALTNVARHAGASEVLVRLERLGERVRVMVRDNGCGFDRAQIHGTGGIGLLGMEERVKLAGGVLRVRSVPGEGTEVCAEFTVPS
jgi:PAS domain S-box-containing protein